jgi:hypothetical protein
MSFSLHNTKIFIFIFIAAEFGLYVLIRQLVNGKEWITACEFQTSCSEAGIYKLQGGARRVGYARNYELRGPMR